MLCFLHGYDEAALLHIERALTRHGPLRPGRSRKGIDYFIIVAPQLPAPGGDVWVRYANAVRKIVTEVQKTQGADPARTYLTGFSFGGNGVIRFGSASARPMGGAVSVEPTRVPMSDPRLPIWLSFGEVSRRYKQQFKSVLSLNDAATRIIGDRLFLDQGQDHVGSATLAYRRSNLCLAALEGPF
jgi:hypothetical protein